MAGFEFLSDGKEDRLLLLIGDGDGEGKTLVTSESKWTAHVPDELTLGIL
jgi:hypothetical protein